MRGGVLFYMENANEGSQVAFGLKKPGVIGVWLEKLASIIINIRSLSV